jgi:hypothetical protein
MNNIHDPVTGTQYSIFSNNAHDFGHDTCVINTLNWIGMPEDLVLELIAGYKKERINNPSKVGINANIYLAILDKWVDKLVEPSNPEHKRLIPGKIDPFKFVPITIREPLTIYEYIPALANKVFSYIKPMTSRILQIFWKDRSSHLTCAGRDGNNMPFMAELQNDNPEVRDGDCIYIPYGWHDVLGYFSNASEVLMLMGGPTLRPVGDSHKFVSIGDVPIDTADEEEGGGGGGKSIHSASEGQLSHPPGIEQPVLTKTLSNKMRLANRGNIIMHKIMTSPRRKHVIYGEDEYDDELLERYRKEKIVYPAIYQIAEETEPYIGEHGFFDLIDHGFTTADEFFKPERVQYLLDLNYDKFSILMLQYHANPDKIKEYYPEMYELTKEHETLKNGAPDDKYLMTALEMGYTRPEELLKAIKTNIIKPSEQLTNVDIIKFAKMFPEIKEIIADNRKLYDFVKLYGFDYFMTLINLGYNTLEKLLDGLKDGSLNEVLSDKEVQTYKNMFKDDIMNKIANLEYIPSGKNETLLMKYNRYLRHKFNEGSEDDEDYEDNEDDYYGPFNLAFGEDAIFDKYFIEKLVKETEDVLGRKLNLQTF